MSRQSFHKGLGFYKAGNYQEALEHFNEAVDRGGQNYQILDTRAAVYAKLGQYKEALKDAKKTIDTAPERWQGYARAARVFLQLDKLEPAQTMITLAIERLQETEKERRPSLLSLQEEIRSLQHALEVKRKQFTDHISQLPIEVFGAIARILVEDDHTALIPLLHVSKRWRTVIENTPPIWAKLVLTSRRPRPKAKLWIKRTNGRVKELVVRSGAPVSLNWPGNSLEELQWDDLVVFHCENWQFLPYLRSIGKESAVTKWIGLTLEEVDGPPSQLPLGQSRPFSLHSLSLIKIKLDLDRTKICERITTLRSCTIRSCLAITGSWANFLKANPLLERLELHSLLFSQPLLGILELNHLTTLEVISSVPVDIYTAKMPHLRNLKIGFPIYDTDVFIRHLINTLVGGLTELKLHGCRLDDFTNLFSLLRMSPNLQVLEFTKLANGAASLLDALAAHYTPPTTSNLPVLGPDDLPPILCPKLTHVDFSGCPEVQAGLLMRLIKSRLIGDEPVVLQTTSQIYPTEVSKIESLIIDSCPNVEREWVTRMEKLVPHVSCRYTTTKLARSRILL